MKNSNLPAKIAIYATTSGHSGVDKIFSNLIPGLAQDGYHVDLLRVKNHGPYLNEDKSGINIIQLGCSHAATSLIPLTRYLNKNKPNVLLTDKDKVNRTAILARALAKSKTRLVLRLGTTVSVNLQNKGLLQRWLQFLSIHYLYCLADNIIVPSQGVALDLAQFSKLSLDKIKVVPSPIITDNMLAQAQEEVGHPWLKDKKVPVLLGVGELSARKDYQTLIKALALLRTKLDCRLIILGEGTQRQALQNLAKEMKVDDILDLPGFATNPYAYMAKADLFVHCSRWEGMPVSLIEAMGLGVPVVSTDCPSGPSEILQNGKLGGLAKVNDHIDLAKKIVFTLLNPLKPEQLQAAVTDYTLTNSLQKYINMLDS